MKPCGTSAGGVATGRVAQTLSQQQLRELLVALTKTPTGVVLQVGFILRLVVMMTALPTGDRTGERESDAGVTDGSKPSLRVIRAPASPGSPAARRRSSLTIEEKGQAVATIATAMKQGKQAEPLGEKGGSGAAKGSGEGEKAKQAKNRKVEKAAQAKQLQDWAAKAKRNVPSLLELLESGVSTIDVEHARLIKSHAEGIPVEKAVRAALPYDYVNTGSLGRSCHSPFHDVYG